MPHWRAGSPERGRRVAPALGVLHGGVLYHRWTYIVHRSRRKLLKSCSINNWNSEAGLGNNILRYL